MKVYNVGTSNLTQERIMLCNIKRNILASLNTIKFIHCSLSSNNYSIFFPSKRNKKNPRIIRCIF